MSNHCQGVLPLSNVLSLLSVKIIKSLHRVSAITVRLIFIQVCVSTIEMALPKVWTSDPLKGERLQRLCPRRLCLAKKKYQKEIESSRSAFASRSEFSFFIYFFSFALRERRETRLERGAFFFLFIFFLLNINTNRYYN
jgi:hypothetical protein